MTLGKITIFIVGLLAGAGIMLFMAGGDEPDGGSASEVAMPIKSEPTSVRSPFAILEEPDSVSGEVEVTNNVQMSPELEALAERIEKAELRIDELENTVLETQISHADIFDNSPGDPQPDLLAAGFDIQTISEIEAIRSESQLQRLNLRDQATREGWIDTDRYRDTRRGLSDSRQLLDRLGEEDYDKLLIAEGRNNRVRIESVIASSAADIAGIQAGDIVNRYAGERIFSFRTLQRATTAGERGQNVNIQIKRNDELIDLVIPRGPMGVTLVGVVGGRAAQ